jgi:FMN-dependent oxidoreductase (nitrilotriacetate monooxygenase family)
VAGNDHQNADREDPNAMTIQRMRLNGFVASTVAHTTAGLWRHPRSQARRYRELDFWTETAKTLESGLFDGLFIADALGVLDTYRDSADQVIREGLQIPADDPLLAISAMAAVTANLGFGVTVSTMAEQPYLLARRFTTLDHLTGGRIGWNVVTGALESAAVNLGLAGQLPHDERYLVADEFLEVTYRLWEASWEDGAVVEDRESGVFADPAAVHPIAHHGRYFDVPGIFLSEPSAQRTPVIYQAGASPAGLDFAAKHAEGVFMSAPSTTVIRKRVDRLRELVVSHGRDPRDARVFAIMTVVTAETDEEARAKFDEYRSFASIEGNLARLSGITQVDLSRLDLDEPLAYVDAPGIQSILAGFTIDDPDRVWTPRAIAEHMAVSSFGPVVVGGPHTVADELERWMDDGDVDGFNIVNILPPESFTDFVTWVIPELQRRGRVWPEYEGATLRERFDGAGNARVKNTHPAARHRPTASAPVSGDHLTTEKEPRKE